jgi:ABC-type sulfate/molybdate transport systems ATPase subunit
VSWRATICARRGAFVLDVDVEVDNGPLVVLGPNGSGKTTFLRVLAGAVAPERAEIVVDDRPFAHHGWHLPMEARRVGYVPQGCGLFPHLTVLGNVAFGVSNGDRARAMAFLTEIGCAALAERDVRTLSGGEAKRVALARALVMEPAMLLLDEPLAALDALARQRTREFLADRLHRFAGPTVLVTHDLRDAEAVGGRCIVLEGGRVVQSGRLAELRANPATPFVAAVV